MQNYGNNQTLRAVTVKQIAEVRLSATISAVPLLARRVSSRPSTFFWVLQAVATSPDDVLRVDGEDLNNVSGDYTSSLLPNHFLSIFFSFLAFPTPWQPI